MTTTTLIGVTGSSHTTTFHGFWVRVSDVVATSLSMVVSGWGLTLGTLQCRRPVDRGKVTAPTLVSGTKEEK